LIPAAFAGVFPLAREVELHGDGRALRVVLHLLEADFHAERPFALGAK